VTTSGITTLPLTVEEYVAQAAYELGAYASGEILSGEDMEDGIVRFNGMLKMWAGDNLYREATTSLTVTAATGTVALPAGARDVASVRHVVSATNKRLLAEWSRGEYYRLPNRTASGNPTAYYLAKTISALSLYVWPVPAANITLEVDYYRLPEVVTDPSETLDLPEEWQEAVVQGLASRMANMFGSTRTDPSTVARIDQRAAALYQRLLDRDRPDYYSFEPDC
jgi:hypothetical protein